jgi:hypothetical protein
MLNTVKYLEASGAGLGLFRVFGSQAVRGGSDYAQGMCTSAIRPDNQATLFIYERENQMFSFGVAKLFHVVDQQVGAAFVLIGCLFAHLFS